MKLKKLIWSFFGIGFLFSPKFIHAYSFNGSFAVLVNQKFMDDQNLAYTNGTSKWGNLNVEGIAGLHEFSFGLEPLIGFGLSKNSASVFSRDTNGQYVLKADGMREEAFFDYQIYSTMLGFRYAPWKKDFFMVIPYVQIMGVLNYVRYRVTDAAGEIHKLQQGSEFGFHYGAGLLFSFFYDAERQANMSAEWDLTDFDLMTSIRYTPSGYGKYGLPDLKNTGGWDFGLGLLLDW